jgi:hypothetical protein
MRRAVFLIFGAVLLGLGALAASGIDAAAFPLILPAIPLALISNWIDPSARSGLLWDSAHSPPFLNALGITVIYFVPGLLLVGAGFVARAKRAHGGG